MLGNLLKCRASQYAQVPYTICRENGMSGKALGYYTKLQSLPDDFEFTLEGFSKLVKDGTSAVRSGFMELEEFGYLVRARRRLPSGVFNSETVFITLDEPGLSDELKEFLETYDYHIISKTPARETPGLHLDLKSLAPRFRWEHEGYIERKAQQEERIRAKQVNMGLAKDADLGAREGSGIGASGAGIVADETAVPGFEPAVESCIEDVDAGMEAVPGRGGVSGSGIENAGADLEAALERARMEAEKTRIETFGGTAEQAASNAAAASSAGFGGEDGKSVAIADGGERVRRSQPECENRTLAVSGDVWKTKNEAPEPTMWKTGEVNSEDLQNRRSQPECENRTLAVSGQDSDVEAEPDKSSQVATRMRKSTCGKSKTILNSLDTPVTIPLIETLTKPGVRAGGPAGAQALDVLEVNPDGLTPTLPVGSSKPESAPAFSERTVLEVADRLASENLAPSSARLRYASSEPIPATDEKALSSAATSLATALHSECGLAFEDESYNEILFNLTSILTAGAAPLDVYLAFKADYPEREDAGAAPTARDLAKWTLDAWLEFKAGKWRHSDIPEERASLRGKAESVIADGLADIAAAQAGTEGVPEKVAEKCPVWASELLPQYAHGIVWAKDGAIDVVHGTRMRVADIERSGSPAADNAAVAPGSKPAPEGWRIAMEAAIAETAVAETAASS